MGALILCGCVRDSRQDDMNRFVSEKEDIAPVQERRQSPVRREGKAPVERVQQADERGLPVVVLKPEKLEDAPSKQRVSAPAGHPYILRAEVEQAVAAGAGSLLGYVQVQPYSMRRRFLGFEIIRLLTDDPRFLPPHLRPGDVVLQINGIRLKQPGNLYDALMALQTASELEFDIWRNEKRIRVVYGIREQETAATP